MVVNSSRGTSPRKLNYLPFIFLFLIVLIIVLGVVPWLKNNQQLSFNNQPKSGCAEGLVKECSLGGCVGLSTCSGNKWGPCNWNIICEPGKEYRCSENGCAYGRKICNECGSGYGLCKNYTQDNGTSGVVQRE